MSSIYRTEAEASEESIPQVLDFVDNIISSGKNSHPLANSYRNLVEEISIKLIECASRKASITLELKKTLTKDIIEIQCPGDPVNLYSDDKNDFGGMILSDFSDKVAQSYRSGVNKITITTARNVRLQTFISLIIILLGSLIGLLINLTVSSDVYDLIDGYVINPIITAYITFLKALAPTMAFFSLMSAIPKILHRTGSDRRLKRLVIGFFICALSGILICMAVIMSMYGILGTIEVNRLAYVEERGNIMGKTISEFIINSIPNDILSPFSLSNPLPMLMLALVLGFASASIYNKRGDSIRSATESISVLFNTAFGILYNSCFTPLVFLAAIEGFAHNGLHFANYIGLSFICIMGGILIMFIIYAIYMLKNGINPLNFYKENKKLLIENFIIGSNIDAIPYNKRSMRRNLDITTPILSDGLYLGGLIDMTGNCAAITTAIVLMICVFQTYTSYTQLLELIPIIFLLSCGTPNQPGSYLIVMTILMEHIGISTEICYVTLIMEALTCRFYSFTNTFGDIVGMIVCFGKTGGRGGRGGR